MILPESYPQGAVVTDEARRAVGICRTCPVAEDCLADALAGGVEDLDPWSVRGGHLPGELLALGQTLEHLGHLGAGVLVPGSQEAVIEGRVEWMRSRGL